MAVVLERPSVRPSVRPPFVTVAKDLYSVVGLSSRRNLNDAIRSSDRSCMRGVSKEGKEEDGLQAAELGGRDNSNKKREGLPACRGKGLTDC